MDFYLYILIPTVLAIVFFILFRYSRYVSYIFVLSSILYLNDTEGVGVRELVFFSIFGVFILINVVPHFARMEFNYYNIIDGLMLLVILHVLYAIVIGYARGNAIYEIVKEPTYFIGAFAYFGYRYSNINSKYLFGCLLLISTFILVHNFINYQEILMQATVAWQAEKARATSNIMYLVIGFTFFTVYALKKNKDSVLILSILFTLGIILSQSRAYWVATFISLLLILFIVKGYNKYKLIGYLTGATGVMVVGLLSIGYNIVDLIISGLGQRLSTFANVMNDVSLIQRYYETKTVLSKIAANPIAGFGFGATFLRRSIVMGVSIVTSYIHNGYIAIWYKMGITGLFSFLALFVTNLIVAYKNYRHTRDIDTEIISIVSFIVLILMLIVNNTSPHFYDFGSLLIVGVVSYFNVKHYNG